jgi:FkbM family methyltransferase
LIGAACYPFPPYRDSSSGAPTKVCTETVRIGPLSESLGTRSIDEPALLKLDVQGYELEALRGCEELFERFAYVCAEGSFIELYEGQVLADDLDRMAG